MKDLIRSLKNHYLQTAQYIRTSDPSIISTVLGSCVSVTFHCPVEKVGGICHALLPSMGKPFSASGWDDDVFRFVDSSIEYMIRDFTRIGVRFSSLEVKIFGGAQQFTAGRSRESVFVGQRNVEVAQAALEQAGIRVLTSDVGGLLGRKILFLPHTGEVFLKKIRSSHPQPEPKK